MKPCRLTLCLLSFGLACSAGAQEFTTKAGGPTVLKFSPDSVVMLKEVGALVGQDKGVLKILLAPPSSRKLTGVQTVDIATGDEVGMAAGKRIHIVGELRELYESAETGSEFKLGVRREGTPIVVTFTKKDPAELSAGGMMVIKAEAPEEGSSLFPALGFRLKEVPEGLTVTESFPAGAFSLETGDLVRSLNGTPVITLKEFETTLQSIEVGEATTLVLSRKGKELTFSAPRPEPRGTVVRIK
jgi:S1-C subfamily serine protease